jgi:ketosteroid isomerase-like protein
MAVGCRLSATSPVITNHQSPTTNHQPTNHPSMPEPPAVNLFTRYVLENPWPLGLVLLALAAVMAWTGMRDGFLRRTQTAVGLALLGLIVILAGLLVTTAGERAKAVTRSLVEAAVAGDTIGAVSHFADDAVLTVGSPRNPGFELDFIRDQLIRLRERYQIDSNSITMLKGFTESSDLGTVHLACYTTVNGFPYATPSRWVVQVRRQPDGEWKVERLTCVSIGDKTPPIGQLW